jgi:hypothetical protein
MIAVDWSGAKDRAERRLWLAEAGSGRIVSLERGRTRAALVDHLIAQAARTPSLAVGLDFAFSLPAWYLADRGLTGAPGLWELAADQGESWLSECAPPFWGRPGRRRPDLQDGLRQTERSVPSIGGVLPKSVFQVGGAGSVGTGSLRGMPFLKRLREAGFAIWPFDAPRYPMVIEIYPRVLTGAVKKRHAPARAAYLAMHYPALSGDVVELASASEDAFDACVSALVMDGSREEITAIPTVSDTKVLLEGWIWAPQNCMSA